MAKKAKVWDGSAWQDLVNATQDLTPYSTTAQMNTAIAASAGLTQIVPTSINKGASGTASVSAGGTITFSGTESISANGVFTTSYDNYLVLLYYVQSTSAELYGRLRTSGTDNTSSSYKYQRQRAYGTTINATFASNNYMEVGSFNSPSTKTSIVMNLFVPAQSEVTAYQTNMGSYDYQHEITGIFDNTTSFDGISFYSLSGSTNIGKLAIYGYKRG